MTKPNHQTIIDAIGAPKLRTALGVTIERVSNWRHRGIPLAYLAPVKAVADAEGVQVPTDFLAPLGLPAAEVAA